MEMVNSDGQMESYIMVIKNYKYIYLELFNLCLYAYRGMEKR